MKHTILIADDDESLVEVLSKRLRIAGYETLATYEGIRTIERAHKDEPDLIILDWKMPTGSGDAVLEYLFAEKITRKIPVIILTGMDDPDIKEKAIALGARAFIKKPYEPKHLLQVIEDILSNV